MSQWYDIILQTKISCVWYHNIIMYMISVMISDVWNHRPIISPVRVWYRMHFDTISCIEYYSIKLWHRGRPTTLPHSFITVHLRSKICAMAWTSQHSRSTYAATFPRLTYEAVFTLPHVCCRAHTAELFRRSQAAAFMPAHMQQLSCCNIYAATSMLLQYD